MSASWSVAAKSSATWAERVRKSTTAKILAGLLEPPSAGHVRFDGRLIDHDPDRVPAAPRLRAGRAPPLPLPVRPRVSLSSIGRLRELPEPHLTRKIDRMLELFGLHGAADQAIASYLERHEAEGADHRGAAARPRRAHLRRARFGPRHHDHARPAPPAHASPAAARPSFTARMCSSSSRNCARRVIVLHRGKLVADDAVERLRGLQAAGSLEEVFGPTRPA